MIRKHLPLWRVAAAAASLAAAGSVSAASFSLVSSVGGAPTGVSLVNFDLLNLGTGSPQVANGPSGTVTVSLTPDAAVVEGSVPGVYAAPYVSGSNGTGFGNGPGEDATRYLTTGSTGATAGAAVRLDFAADQQYMGLLWGSVDTYNTLSFYDSSNVLLGSVVGTDVTAAATGDQGVNGTRYVNINWDAPFRYVIATSSQYAFEFDNVAYNPTTVTVPDTGWTLGLTGFGLLAVGLVRRKLA